ncbi:MAG: hypothetical protein KF784_02535 [Fimbriimonadaceae bacterium]|nr:hypothetical protein [Fimbriimonadaceae bacterium]
MPVKELFPAPVIAQARRVKPALGERRICVARAFLPGRIGETSGGRQINHLCLFVAFVHNFLLHHPEIFCPGENATIGMINLNDNQSVSGPETFRNPS